MGVDVDRLVAIHPQLYHMAEDGSWPSIARFGLLSTSALLDLFEISGDDRIRIESTHRPNSIRLSHPIYGEVVIRDQAPMDDAGLQRALTGTGLEPRDWYLLLNRRVFFWLTEERLARMLSAGNYRARPHLVLTIDTRELVDRHWNRISLSPINTGATKPMPAPRGPGTFQSPNEYPFAELRRRRRVKDVIVELAVDYAVRDITDLVVERRRMVDGTVLSREAQ